MYINDSIAVKLKERIIVRIIFTLIFAIIICKNQTPNIRTNIPKSG